MHLRSGKITGQSTRENIIITKGGAIRPNNATTSIHNMKLRSGKTIKISSVIFQPKPISNKQFCQSYDKWFMIWFESRMNKFDEESKKIDFTCEKDAFIDACRLANEVCAVICEHADYLKTLPDISAKLNEFIESTDYATFCIEKGIELFYSELTDYEYTFIENVCCDIIKTAFLLQ